MTSKKGSDKIFELARGFMSSRIFTTAVKLDVFTVLEQHPEGKVTAASASAQPHLCFVNLPPEVSRQRCLSTGQTRRNEVRLPTGTGNACQYVQEGVQHMRSLLLLGAEIAHDGNGLVGPEAVQCLPFFAAGLTCMELAKEVGLCQTPGFRGSHDFFDCLVSLAVMEKRGDGDACIYTNTRGLVPYLVRGNKYYLGDLVVLNNDRSYWHFAYLEEALKTGKAPDLSIHNLSDPVSLFQGQGGDAVAFARSMSSASLGGFRNLFAEQSGFNLAPYKTLGDFGGSLASLSIMVAELHPHMKCTSYDLPILHDAAEQNVKEHGLSDQVQVRDFDFFCSEPFPEHDVITMSMVLHDWGLQKKKELMRKAFAALPIGGAFIAVDNVIDNARVRNTHGMTVSLNMLLEFGNENAFEYTFKEFESWAQEIGFSKAECRELHFDSKSACIAIK